MPSGLAAAVRMGAVSLADVRRRAIAMPPGYYTTVTRAGVVEGGRLHISQDTYRRLCMEFGERAAKDVAEARLVVCGTCPHHGPDDGVFGPCRHPDCGCPRNNPWLVGARCPGKKWGS